MAQIGRVSTKVEIKSPAEKLYGFFRHKMHHLAQMFPQNLKSFKFLEGNDFIAGSLMRWECNIVGDVTVESRVEEVDEEKKSITYKLEGGDLIKQYSFFKVTFKAVDGDNGVSTVDWSLEFEKANEAVPSPLPYMDFVALLSKALDAYLINN